MKMPKITLQKYLEEYVLKITLETLYMVGISAIIATIIAIVFGSVLYNLRKSSNRTCQVIYKNKTNNFFIIFHPFYFTNL